MLENLPVRQPSLANQVARILIRRIRAGRYLMDRQLPSEIELAEEFGVSRTTIRSALNSLAARNLVVRRQGVGTFVSQASQISNPLNRFIDFNDLISSQGAEPGFRHISANIVSPVMGIAQKLDMGDHDRILEVHKVFTADDDPVIYAINRIPLTRFRPEVSREDLLAPGYTEPFFTFLGECCAGDIQYVHSQVSAEIADRFDFLAEYMGVKGNAPVLVIDEIAFTSTDEPLLNSVEYHPGRRMTFDLIRRYQEM